MFLERIKGNSEATVEPCASICILARRETKTNCLQSLKNKKKCGNKLPSEELNKDSVDSRILLV